MTPTFEPMRCSRCGRETNQLYTFTDGPEEGICPDCLPKPQVYSQPTGPNNCNRFIYGQGCWECGRQLICWPTSTSSTLTLGGAL